MIRSSETPALFLKKAGNFKLKNVLNDSKRDSKIFLMKKPDSFERIMVQQIILINMHSKEDE